MAPLVAGLAAGSAGAGEGDGRPALKDVFAGVFLVGAALKTSQILGEEPEAMAVVERHFNTITAENDMKWERIHPEPGRYEFAIADAFVEFGETHGMFIVGHTLVWQNQTPRWVFREEDGEPVDRDTLLQRMKEHIAAVVGRYRGRVDGSFRRNRWHRIIGDDFIEKAFAFAHEADPEAELYYNDFDMWKPEKVERVVRLVRDLRAKGIRIDGVGLQGHWGHDFPEVDEVEDAIQAYADAGINVMVTEMDISMLPDPMADRGADITRRRERTDELDPYVDGLPDDVQARLDERYASFFKIFVDHRDAFTRATLWGVNDGNSWRNNWPIRGRTEYPLLFDRDNQPKSTFDAVVGVMKSEP
jgi:endo-1,4-beta-xylanase